ncbi:MAG: hypothetical protein WCJ69_17455 [Betaproteobacteria bacterium]|jgi:hypothetical protein
MFFRSFAWRIFLLVVLPGQAFAFVLSSGAEVRCDILLDGRSFLVDEEYIGNGAVGERHPELGGSAAVVRRGVDGRPRIVFDRFVLEDFRRRLPAAADFVFLHECSHLRQRTRDEILANCHALVDARARGLLGPTDEDALGRFHQALGRLPLRYGGTGSAFWRLTLECASRPEAFSEDAQAFPGGAFDPPYSP